MHCQGMNNHVFTLNHANQAIIGGDMYGRSQNAHQTRTEEGKGEENATFVVCAAQYTKIDFWHAELFYVEIM
jgi:hypothetical protein